MRTNGTLSVPVAPASRTFMSAPSFVPLPAWSRSLYMVASGFGRGLYQNGADECPEPEDLQDRARRVRVFPSVAQLLKVRRQRLGSPVDHPGIHGEDKQPPRNLRRRHTCHSNLRQCEGRPRLAYENRQDNRLLNAPPSIDAPTGGPKSR